MYWILCVLVFSQCFCHRWVWYIFLLSMKWTKLFLSFFWIDSAINWLIWTNFFLFLLFEWMKAIEKYTNIEREKESEQIFFFLVFCCRRFLYGQIFIDFTFWIELFSAIIIMITLYTTQKIYKLKFVMLLREYLESWSLMVGFFSDISINTQTFSFLFFGFRFKFLNQVIYISSYTCDGYYYHFVFVAVFLVVIFILPI